MKSYLILIAMILLLFLGCHAKPVLLEEYGEIIGKVHVPENGTRSLGTTVEGSPGEIPAVCLQEQFVVVIKGQLHTFRMDSIHAYLGFKVGQECKVIFERDSLIVRAITNQTR